MFAGALPFPCTSHKPYSWRELRGQRRLARCRFRRVACGRRGSWRWRSAGHADRAACCERRWRWRQTCPAIINQTARTDACTRNTKTQSGAATCWGADETSWINCHCSSSGPCTEAHQFLSLFFLKFNSLYHLRFYLFIFCLHNCLSSADEDQILTTTFSLRVSSLPAVAAANMMAGRQAGGDVRQTCLFTMCRLMYI